MSPSFRFGSSRLVCPLQTVMTPLGSKELWTAIRSSPSHLGMYPVCVAVPAASAITAAVSIPTLCLVLSGSAVIYVRLTDQPYDADNQAEQHAHSSEPDRRQHILERRQGNPRA